MHVSIEAAALGLAFALAGCATGLSDGMTVADYCANPDRTNEAVCRLKVDVDGNSTAISDTQMSLTEARALSDSALTAANEAKSMAAEALQVAGEQNLTCKTVTINNSDTGTCEPGYIVMGCTQTRYTTRAGGLSFLRDVNNESCRFNARVLEMDVRCCTSASVGEASSPS